MQKMHEEIATHACRSCATLFTHQGNIYVETLFTHVNPFAGAQAAAPAQRSTPGSSSALLAADYGSDEEEGASIQGSAATPANGRDGSQSANGLPQGFFEVC